MKIGKWVKKDDPEWWVDIIWVDPTGKIGLGIDELGYTDTWNEKELVGSERVYQEPELKRDDLVEVSNDGKCWLDVLKRFAFKDPHGDGIYCYSFGRSSKETNEVTYWKHWRRK